MKFFAVAIITAVAAISIPEHHDFSDCTYTLVCDQSDEPLCPEKGCDIDFVKDFISKKSDCDAILTVTGSVSSDDCSNAGGAVYAPLDNVKVTVVELKIDFVLTVADANIAYASAEDECDSADDVPELVWADVGDNSHLVVHTTSTTAAPGSAATDDTATTQAGPTTEAPGSAATDDTTVTAPTSPTASTTTSSSESTSSKIGYSGRRLSRAGTVEIVLTATIPKAGNDDGVASAVASVGLASMVAIFASLF